MPVFREIVLTTSFYLAVVVSDRNNHDNNMSNRRDRPSNGLTGRPRRPQNVQFAVLLDTNILLLTAQLEGQITPLLFLLFLFLLFLLLCPRFLLFVVHILPLLHPSCFLALPSQKARKTAMGSFPPPTGPTRVVSPSLLPSTPASSQSSPEPSSPVSPRAAELASSMGINLSDGNTRREMVRLEDPKICSYCGRELPREFQARGRLKVREQWAECQRHRRADLLQECKEKGYPAAGIAWDALKDRVMGRGEAIRRLLNGADSRFRHEYQRIVDRGEDRAPITSRRNHVLGYYGMKGFAMISDILMTNFAGELRERAPYDPLIRARAPVEFVHYVIIPELAVQIVMEDMGVGSWDEARNILEESKQLGGMLFPCGSSDRIARRR